MINDINKILYLDFTQLLPEDSYFYNSFYNKCIESGYDTVLINWGSSFPWSIDERLNLNEHLSEKTLYSFNTRIAEAGLKFVPVLPLFGGMEILLSFSSYCYLRFENLSSVLNPESPGSKQILANFINDYISLIDSADSIAFNCFMINKIAESKNLNSAAVLLNSVLEDENKIKNILFYGSKKDRDLIVRLSSLINIKNIQIIIADNQYPEIISRGESKKVIYNAPGIDFYIPDKYKNDYYAYKENILSAWNSIRILKKEILRSISSRIPSLHNEGSVLLSYNELVDLFSKIRKTSDGIKDKIDDSLNENMLNLFLGAELRIIENEIKYIEIDISNCSADLRIK